MPNSDIEQGYKIGVFSPDVLIKQIAIHRVGTGGLIMIKVGINRRVQHAK